MRTAALVLALVMGSVSAWAQGAPPTEKREGDRVVTRQKTYVDMAEVEISGVLRGPDVPMVWARKKTKFRNLIEVRADFRREIATSAAGL